MDRIVVKCRAADNLDVHDLRPLQGNLKTLSIDRYEKLKKSILKYGISMPFLVWKHKDANWILDGHQRDRVLMKMEEEGYEIPPIPCAYIDAKNKKEAKQKILLLSSRYGQITEEGLYEFAEIDGIDLKELSEIIDFSDIDFDRFIQGWTPDSEMTDIALTSSGSDTKESGYEKRILILVPPEDYEQARRIMLDVLNQHKNWDVRFT